MPSPTWKRRLTATELPIVRAANMSPRSSDDTPRRGEWPIVPPGACVSGCPLGILCRDHGRSPLLWEGGQHGGWPCTACLLWVCLLRTACHKQDGRQIQCHSERYFHGGVQGEARRGLHPRSIQGQLVKVLGAALTPSSWCRVGLLCVWGPRLMGFVPTEDHVPSTQLKWPCATPLHTSHVGSEAGRRRAMTWATWDRSQSPTHL